MKCPKCGCEKFYIKDPDDEYETYEFEGRDGEICFDPDVDESVGTCSGKRDRNIL